MTQAALPKHALPIASFVLLAAGIVVVWGHLQLFALPPGDIIGMDKTLILNGVLTAALVLAPAGIILRDWFVSGHDRRRLLEPPLLWSLGAFFILLAGTAAGLMLFGVFTVTVFLNPVQIATQINYTLRSCTFLAFFASFYFWTPKLTGYTYRRALAKLHFGLQFGAMILALLPMFFISLMPRRYADYSNGWDSWSVFIVAVSLLEGLGFLVFAAVLIDMLVRRPKAAAGAGR